MPVWLVALAIAGSAPLVVRLLGERWTRRLEERTDKVIAEVTRRARRSRERAKEEPIEDVKAS